MAARDNSQCFECGLCSKPVLKPTILPCLHLLCSACLLDYTSRHKLTSLHPSLLCPHGAYSIPYDHSNALLTAHNSGQLDQPSGRKPHNGTNLESLDGLQHDLDTSTGNKSKGCYKFPVGDSYLWLKKPGNSSSTTGSGSDGATGNKKPSSLAEIDSQYMNKTLPHGNSKPTRQSQVLKDKDGYHFIEDDLSSEAPRGNCRKRDGIYEEIDEELRGRAIGTPSKQTPVYECPLCETWFLLTELQNLPDCCFIENKQFSEDLPLKSKRASNNFIAKKLEDLKNSMSENCARHRIRTAHYLCRQCNEFLCCECQNWYHRDHITAHVDDLATRGRDYLRSINEHTQDIRERLENECEEIHHHALAIPTEKRELFDQIAQSHKEASDMLTQTYLELIGQIEVRFQEESTYLDKLLKCNAQHQAYVDHIANISDSVAQYGNKSNVIKIVEPVANALVKEQHTDTALPSKCSIKFTPAPRKHIQFLPLLGTTTRVYGPKTELVSNVAPINIANIETPPKEQSTYFSVRGKNENSCGVSGLCSRQNNDLLIIDNVNRCVKIFHVFGFLQDTKVVEDWGHLWTPRDIATSHTGMMAITDASSHSILLLDQSAKLIANIGTDLADPFGVCFTHNTDIAVTDQTQKCAFIFRPNGKLKQTLKPPNGTMGKPTYLTCSQEGDIAISDPGRRCVHVFSCIGQYLLRIENTFAGCQIFTEPQGIAYDIYGKLLLADPVNKSVLVFDKNGHFECYLLSVTDTQCVFVTKGGKVIVNDGEYIRTFHAPGPRVGKKTRRPAKKASTKPDSKTLKSSSLPEFRHFKGNDLTLHPSYANECQDDSRVLGNVGDLNTSRELDKKLTAIVRPAIVKPKTAPKPSARQLIERFDKNQRAGSYVDMSGGSARHRNPCTNTPQPSRGQRQLTAPAERPVSIHVPVADESQYIEATKPPTQTVSNPSMPLAGINHVTPVNGSFHGRHYVNVPATQEDYVGQSSSSININTDSSRFDSDYSIASDVTSVQSSENSSPGILSSSLTFSLPCVTERDYLEEDDDEVFTNKEQNSDSFNEKTKKSSRVREFIKKYSNQDRSTRSPRSEESPESEKKRKPRNKQNQPVKTPSFIYELRVKIKEKQQKRK